MIVVEKKENDQYTIEIHIENYKNEQISVDHLFKKMIFDFLNIHLTIFIK